MFSEEQCLNRSCIFSALSGFIFGYTLVSSGMLLVDSSFTSEFCVKLGYDADDCVSTDTHEPPTEWTSFTSYFIGLFSLGAMLGSSLSGVLADRVGRRMALVFSAIFFIMGTFTTLLAANKGSVYFSRILVGIAVGLMSSVSPVYIAEIATKDIRGRLSSWMPLILTLGLLFGSISNNMGKLWLLLTKATTGWSGGLWQPMLGFALLPAVIVAVGMALAPESPRWLMVNSGYRQSEKALKRLRNKENVKEELLDVANSCTVMHGVGTYGMLFNKINRYRMVIACGLQICNQLSGIGIILSYGPVIISELGIFQHSFAVVALYSMAFVGTLLASKLVDNMGRRTLLLRGGMGILIGNIGASVTSYLYDNTDFDVYGAACILSICFFMFFFSISWGPICWVYPPEIYPLNVRASAVAVSTLVYYGAMYLSSFSLLIINWVGLTWVLSFLAFCTVLSLFFIYYFIPETKGVNLEDMDHLFELFRASQLKGFFKELCYGSSPLIQRDSGNAMHNEADKLLANKLVHV